MLALALYMPGARAASYVLDETEAQWEALRGKQAFLYSADGPVPVYGYETYFDAAAPWGLYLSGTPVTILRAGYLDGYYDDTTLVQVGEENGGAVFRVLMQHLAFEGTPANSAVMVKAGSLFSDVSAESEPVIELSSDTQAIICGRHENWYHVQVNNKMGFVAVDKVAADEETAHFFEAYRPVSYAQGTQRKLRAQFVYHEELFKRMRDLNASDEMSIEDKAALSLLEAAIGDEVIQIDLLPGAGDISQQEATELANKAFRAVCDVDEAFVANFRVAYWFFEEPQETGIKKWRLNYRARDGEVLRLFSVTLDGKTGEVIETAPKEDVFPPEEQNEPFLLEDDEALRYVTYRQVYEELEEKYGPSFGWSIAVQAELAARTDMGLTDSLPIEGEVTQEEALQTALKLIAEQYEVPEGEFDAYFVLYHFSEDAGLRRWNVIIYPGENPDMASNLYYEVVLDAKTGELLWEIVLPGTTHG